jgi:transcription initiation factor TFIIIB Brf1 subunit/transcription initiation factor TFIIB
MTNDILTSEFINHLFDTIDFPNLEKKNKNCTEQVCNCGIPEYLNDPENSGGFRVCKDCGFAYSGGIIDTGPEWNNYEDSKQKGIDNSRCGKMGDRHLGTRIAKTNNYLFEKLRNLLLYSTPYDSESYKKSELTKLLNGILGESTQEYLVSLVVDIYSKIDKIYRGSNRVALLSVIFYFACIKNNINYNKEQVLLLFNVSLQNFHGAMKVLSNGNIQSVIDTDIFNDPIVICKGLSCNYQLTQKQSNLVIKITEAVLDLNILTQSNPHTLACSVVYFVSRELDFDLNMTTSIFTLKKNYKILLENKQIIFNYIYNKNN